MKELVAENSIFLLTGLLPEMVKAKSPDLIQRVKSLLPEVKIENIGIFERRSDPVLAIEVLGRWYEVSRWG